MWTLLSAKHITTLMKCDTCQEPITAFAVMGYETQTVQTTRRYCLPCGHMRTMKPTLFRLSEEQRALAWLLLG